MSALFTEWLERICANPDDDDLRLVLADLLQEAGDVRGEFIRLELENRRFPADFARRGKTYRLQLANRAAWVPKGVDLESAKFDRGFLNDVQWEDDTDARHLGWRTVRVLRFEFARRLPSGAPLEHASLVREVFGASPVLVTELLRVKAKLRRLETVGEVVPWLSEFAGLQHLTIGRSRQPVPFAWVERLLRTLPALSRLELPAVSGFAEHLYPLVQQRAQPTTLRLVRVTTAQGRGFLELSPGRALIAIDGDVPGVELVNLANEARSTHAKTQEIAFTTTSAPVPLSKLPF